MAFFHDVLKEHGEFLTKWLRLEIKNKELIKSGALIGNINYDVVAVGKNFSLLVTFPDYGRFIEIKYFSKNTLSFLSKNKNLSFLQSRGESKMKKKDTRWYSRVAYKGLKYLISHIMQGISDKELLIMKRILKQDSANYTN